MGLGFHTENLTGKAKAFAADLAQRAGNRTRTVVERVNAALKDLQLDYLDMYYVHWPFPNYHPPFCDVDERNPNSVPFTAERFMNTYRQCEELVRKGLIKHIGISNMTIPKMDATLHLMEIKPAAAFRKLPCWHRGPDLPKCLEFTGAGF